MTDLEVFCRQIRARSAEHQKALLSLHAQRITSQVISILRQELDSMVRAIYLLSITDLQYRNDLIKASVEGRKWTEKGKNKKITDRDMVDLAQNLQGWTESVYRFGCSFIHLSSFHDYKDRDPMDMLTQSEKQDILRHMQYYHGGPNVNDPQFNDLIPYLPRVFQKIADNLECYVGMLEAGDII